MSKKYFYISVNISFSLDKNNEIGLTDKKISYEYESETENSVSLKIENKSKRISKKDINVILQDKTFFETFSIKFYMWTDSKNLETDIKKLKLYAYQYALNARTKLMNSCEKQVKRLNEEIIKLS